MAKKPAVEDAVVSETQAEEVLVKTALSDAEWERRTQLPVHDVEYINPSYDR